WPPRFGDEGDVPRRRDGDISAAWYVVPEAATRAIVGIDTGSNARHAGAGEGKVRVPDMCAARRRAVLTSEHGNDRAGERREIEPHQRIDVVLDRIEIAQRWIRVHGCRFTTRSRVDVRAGESVIEKARGRSAGFDRTRPHGREIAESRQAAV